MGLNPVNGDVYVASVPESVLIFSSSANGNVAPNGIIRGKKTGLKQSQDVALDAAGNIYVSAKNRIQVFAAGSTGNVAPSRTIKGSRTRLNAPGNLAVDSRGNIYVANEKTSSVTVYAPGANGNVAPAQWLEGPATKLKLVNGMTIDASNNVYVSNGIIDGKVRLGYVNAYSTGATGNQAPVSSLKGASTALNNPIGMTVR